MYIVYIEIYMYMNFYRNMYCGLLLLVIEDDLIILGFCI